MSDLWQNGMNLYKKVADAFNPVTTANQDLNDPKKQAQNQAVQSFFGNNQNQSGGFQTPSNTVSSDSLLSPGQVKVPGASEAPYRPTTADLMKTKNQISNPGPIGSADKVPDYSAPKANSSPVKTAQKSLPIQPPGPEQYQAPLQTAVTVTPDNSWLKNPNIDLNSLFGSIANGAKNIGSGLANVADSAMTSAYGHGSKTALQQKEALDEAQKQRDTALQQTTLQGTNAANLNTLEQQGANARQQAEIAAQKQENAANRTAQAQLEAQRENAETQREMLARGLLPNGQPVNPDQAILNALSAPRGKK